LKYHLIVRGQILGVDNDLDRLNMKKKWK